MRIDERFHAFAEGIGAAVVVSDPDGVVRFANTAASELFADLLVNSSTPFVGSVVTDHGWQLLAEHGHRLPMSSNAAGRARATGQAVRDQVIGVVVGDQAPTWLVQSAIPFERADEPGRYDVVSTFVDITARRELEARLEQQAGSDALTGLANRFRYEERLAETIARAERGQEPVALLLIDVDDFKSCNDLHGHGAGDAVLIEVGARLRRLVRVEDTVARLGGDEFALLLGGADERRAREIGDAILAAFVEPVRPVGSRSTTLRVTVSVGAAIRRPSTPVTTFEAAADQALFAAKHAGKNVFVVHDPARPTDRPVEVQVDAADAHAWADYIGALRDEIAQRKVEGRLPATTGAPPSVHRVLKDVVHRIGALPPSGSCRVALPRERDLAPFVFHHASVNRWVDELRRDGVITVEVPHGARRFWMALAACVETAGV